MGVLALVATPLLALQTGVLLAGGAAGYTVGPDDVLRIQVWKQPDLSGSYTVGADGLVAMPLVGRLPVAGLTTARIEVDLTRRLADGFLRDPQVVVSVEQYRSQRVFVSGEVRTPGPINLSGSMTLLEVLARAGALTERAGRTVIVARPRAGAVARQPAAFNGASDIQRVDLRALGQGSLDANVTVQDGDTIFVPPAATVHVMGEVGRPGEYPIFEDTRVAEVLSKAGGLTERGSLRGVRLIRVDSTGKKSEVKVALEDTLRPGDIVVVRERLF